MAKNKAKAYSRESDYSHASQRALERYGLDLDNAALSKLCKEIADGKHVMIGRDETGTHWLVRIGKTVVRLVTSEDIRYVVTFLPSDAYDFPRSGERDGPKARPGERKAVREKKKRKKWGGRRWGYNHT